MKLYAIATAALLAGVAGVATAGQPVRLMEPVPVTAEDIGTCAPPDGASSPFCVGYEQMLEAHFTPTQIGELYGYRTSYPAYRTGGIATLRQRCELLVQGYLAGRGAASSEAAAAAGCEGTS